MLTVVEMSTGSPLNSKTASKTKELDASVPVLTLNDNTTNKLNLINEKMPSTIASTAPSSTTLTTAPKMPTVQTIDASTVAKNSISPTLRSNECESPDDVFKNLTEMLEQSAQSTKNQQNHNSCQINGKQINRTKECSEISNMSNNIKHLPKRFTNVSAVQEQQQRENVTKPSPTKDSIGSKLMNLIQFKNNNEKQQQTAPSDHKPNSNGSLHHRNGSIETSSVSTKTRTQTAPTPIKPLQPVSACYDRYPKPGSYGSLQVFPMNGINCEINKIASPKTPHRIHIASQDDEKDLSRSEQDRLEELLKICTDFERQNQNVQSSPIVQNRIKTNGSLPRDKKATYNNDYVNTIYSTSPSDDKSYRQQITSPIKNLTNGNHSVSSSTTNGYENVCISPGKNVEILTMPKAMPIPAISSSTSTTLSSSMSTSAPSTGYENVCVSRKSPVGYVPQSPRTRIKTCISTKREMQTSTPVSSVVALNVSRGRKTEYDLLVQSFEEKLQLEIQQLRGQHYNGRRNEKSISEPKTIINSTSTPVSKATAPKTVQHNYINLDTPTKWHDTNESMSDEKKNHDFMLAPKVTTITATTTPITSTKITDKSFTSLNIKKNLDDMQIAQLRRQRDDVLKNMRDLKAEIADLQRQEDEVLRELDLEKALISAELSTELNYLNEMEKQLNKLQGKIHRLEAQRNANRVLQETQQNKLKQSIEMKQNQIEGLEKLCNENSDDDALRDELNKTIEMLENDTKTFEDLEFQYLEEETEWLAYREEMHTEQKHMLNRIDEKRNHVDSLELQCVDNQNIACADTKTIETNLFSMLNKMEKLREELKTFDVLLYEMSGQKSSPPESDDEYALPQKKQQNGITGDLLSHSMFGSQEMLQMTKLKSEKFTNGQSNDLMSKSLNENLFSNKIETLSMDYIIDSLKCPIVDNCVIDNSKRINEINENHSNRIHSDTQQNDIEKLKYKLASPYDHNADIMVVDDQENNKKSAANLNLSIESDDFEVNPLEKRVPSQDDIDRICKVTNDAPISAQCASFKVIESFKEIERNRQLLLTQQGSHIIEHERQKMNELKKKSHDQARAQYLQLQNHNGIDEMPTTMMTSSTPNATKQSTIERQLPIVRSTHTTSASSPQRHSHPELERERILSSENVDNKYTTTSMIDKLFKSSNDIQSSSEITAIENNSNECYSNDSRRNSVMSSENSDSGSKMISGTKRNLPKHQRPLTRYLPIMSTDLDLRAHIESAGHQVSLCPHVFVDSFTCRGYLHKLGATFHGWSRRWFVLDRQKMALIYYSDKSERKPRGGAYFSTIDEVYLDHLNTSKSGRPHCTFIVKTKRRSYHLQAASDAAARIWIDAIITGAQGNIDY